MAKFYFPVPIEYKEAVENKIRGLKVWKDTLKVYYSTGKTEFTFWFRNSRRSMQLLCAKW